ncbi:hypothetical protein Goshw_028846 [Gossypium schwendimanii]|uniref:Uncharacterized protein n=6 Tax=Gossypium TaxID=3633 RepID=A0A7J9J828_9ROSI|nr:hypothetical protein [Gossypium lobatum]MBA0651316.1 hypothetical protein [Gossypium klotzschianum]MBA0713650.1 hypothetical protein [Gossypium laxum]MBA0800996.1 hypothetical protein [Gossypium harknessii]MBA0830551.1 hypothetical protein [Gossypium armourianum]MBA0858621.1 hypothetical protein [Gossypium schwendimanii]
MNLRSINPLSAGVWRQETLKLGVLEKWMSSRDSRRLRVLKDWNS